MPHLLFYAMGLLAGIPVGLLIKSDTERKLRGNLMPWLPFGASSLPRLMLGSALKLILVLPLFFIPLYLISELAHFFALGVQAVLVNFLYLLGILIGKGIRYGYWRHKDPRV